MKVQLIESKPVHKWASHFLYQAVLCHSYPKCKHIPLSIELL